MSKIFLNFVPELKIRVMKGYFIINKNGAILHSNNYFYDCIIGGFGCNMVMYKSQKCAENRAQKVSGIVVEFYKGETIRDAIKRKFDELVKNNC
jgi:hypothetical protein